MSDEEADKHLRQKLAFLKIVKCENCQHFARHPEASNSLEFDKVPNSATPCIKKQCSHNCSHVLQTTAKWLIVNCNELQHLQSQNALKREDVNDDPENVLTCFLKNCSKKCSHMVSAQSIER